MICFVIGFGLGTVAGILRAPKAGAETGATFKTRCEKETSMSSAVATTFSTAAETVARGKQTLQNQIQSVSDAVEAPKQTYREKVTGRQTVRRRFADLVSLHQAFRGQLLPDPGLGDGFDDFTYSQRVPFCP